ncbi:DNA cytosine methyltransferase, partial [Saccharothrix sp. MB29]|nr:DNA cytosine methyltransferase [Saccharothrix sp. MB29]
MIDLFAGCGGMTSGFVAAGGYAPVMAVEWDLHAAAT